MRILRVDELGIDKLDENHRKAFVRVDFNVPIEKGEVIDDYRIRQAVPTIKYLLDHKCLVIVAAHLGRPKPKDEKSKQEFTLLPVAEKLAEIMNHEVLFAEETYGDCVRKLVLDGRPGKTLILLENLRFDAREEENNSDFAEKLFQHCDLYVNDAFGACHRAHASIEAITHFAKLKGAGFLLSKEWEVLNQVLHHPKKPQYAILGGSKISDKIQVIKNLMTRTKALFVGGRMANTFLAAQGFHLGSSSIEEDNLPVARRIMAEAKQMGVAMHFPVDALVADKKDATSAKAVELSKDAPLKDGLSVFDIGPKTLDVWTKELKQAKSVIWNGPMGVFENPTFANGTLKLVDFLVSENSKIEATVGGGETVAAVTERGALEKLFHVSTGGGAMLEFLEGKELPGFESLKLRERELEALASNPQ